GCGRAKETKETLRPASCGGTVTTDGSVRGTTFSATSIDVIAVNGHAISLYLTDVDRNEQLWFSIQRDPSTRMFAPGSYQGEAVFAPNLVGSVSVDLTQVVDPYDMNGRPVPAVDGGVVGSVAG